jgi:CubicO group peptidase (beta-lactamase class C family)
MQQVERWVIGASKDTAVACATQQAVLQSLPFITLEYPEYDLMSYSDRHYSNLGYSMLGIALERAAKTQYITYVKQHIMQPLGMNSSGFLQDADNPKIAAGYRYDDSTKLVTRTPVFVPNAAMAAGGVYSTARDLAKYISFQFRDDAAANQVLPATDKAMMRAFKIAWKPAYPFVMHEGAMLGHRCEVFFSPSLKLGWVILTNVSDFEFNRINAVFSQLLTPLFNKKPDTDLHKYTGTYKLAGGAGSLDISIRNGQLYSTYLAEQLGNVPLTPAGDNHFQVKVPGASYSLAYEFITDAASPKMILNLDQFMWVKE